ncbi:uncharacterized protein LOC134750788 [Cydia strobilella]|uniref:uncharacterized protein LOC134750788 n=1 Tax=Cydia strobilella TaxID=1100964 RepID=UPI003005D560
MFLIILSVSLVFVNAAPNPEEKENDKPTLETAARIIGKDCAKGILSPTCLKIGVISLLEKVNNKDEVALLPGLTLVKDTNENKAEAVAKELAKSLPSNPDERLDKFLLYRLGTFLDTHSVKLRLLDEDTAEEAKSILGEARGRKPFGMGKKGGMGGLMAMAMMMKGKGVFLLQRQNRLKRRHMIQIY